MQKATEGVLRAIPNIVRANVSQQAKITELTNGFYQANQDLQKYKPVVAAVAAEVSSKHSDWTYEQVLEETEKVARARLAMKKAAVQSASAEEDASFAHRGNTSKKRKSRPKTSGLEAEIAQLNKQLDML
jgi:nucleoid-associated protein YgaU